MRRAVTPHNREAFATEITRILRWCWFDVEFGDPYGEGRTPALLLIGIYLADQRGKPFNIGKACAFSCVDRSTTGPKFIRRFEEAGLITIKHHLGDRRKQFIHATEKLRSPVEQELDKLQRTLKATNH